MTKPIIHAPLTEGPKWLGPLRLEHTDRGLVMTATSSKGYDKYEWTIDKERA